MTSRKPAIAIDQNKFRFMPLSAWILAASLWGCGGTGVDSDESQRPEVQPLTAIDPALVPSKMIPATQIEKSDIGIASTQTIPGLFTPFFIPPHTAGDTEYNGHGPITTFQARLFVANGNQLWLSIHMRAIETRSDWTTAEGTQQYLLATTQGNISGVLTNAFSTHSYRDTNHGRDIFAFQPGDLVQQLEYVGDTRGNDAGSRTGVQVFLQPITVVIQ